MSATLKPLHQSHCKYSELSVQLFSVNNLFDNLAKLYYKQLYRPLVEDQLENWCGDLHSKALTALKIFNQWTSLFVHLYSCWMNRFPALTIFARMVTKFLKCVLCGWYLWIAVDSVSSTLTNTHCWHHPQHCWCPEHTKTLIPSLRSSSALNCRYTNHPQCHSVHNCRQT
jgi:hypothetical protein